MTERADEQLSPPDEPQARRRSAPWLLGGLVLALLFVLVALQVFGVWEVVTPATAADTIITVSLLPITAMAVFSYLFFNRTLEKMFGRVPEDVVQEAKLARDEDLTQQAGNLHETARVAALAAGQQLAQNVKPDLEALRAQGNFDELAVMDFNARDTPIGAEWHFNDSVNPARRPELDAAIARVLDHGLFILGPEVTELEDRIAQYCGTRWAVACASGSDAM